MRETTAPYEYTNDSGEIKTDPIRVRYYSSTTKELKEAYAAAQAKIKSDETAIFWHTDKLVKRLESLPDLVDENEQPFEITLDFLESLDAKNVSAIVKAIEEDENPKSERPA